MSKQYPYTREELLDYLHKLNYELGRKPAKKDVPEEMRPYYRVLFGKWCYALEVAGIVIPSERTLARRMRHKNKHKAMNAVVRAKKEHPQSGS